MSGQLALVKDPPGRPEADEVVLSTTVAPVRAVATTVRRDAERLWQLGHARLRGAAAAAVRLPLSVLGGQDATGVPSAPRAAGLRDLPTGPGHGRVLTTVMFTDLVGSTRLAAELGDSAWGDLLGRHDRVVRAELRRHGGREVKTLGDGFMAVFDGPGQAIRCARAIEAAVRALGVAFRAGVHCGECERVGDDLRGITVNIAARVAALAPAGEVLVSGTVRDVLAGSTFSFADDGVHELRGVPGQWQLFRAGAGTGAGGRGAPR